MKTSNAHLLKTLALSLTVSAISTADAKSGDSFVNLPKEIENPESIGLDTGTGALYVGSAGNGSVAVVEKDGTVKVLQAPGHDGREGAYGVKVDSRRHRLWVLDGAAAYIYDLNSNTLIKKVTSPEVTEANKAKTAFLNDLAIDTDGSAFITDSFSPKLYKVDGKTLTLKVHAELKGIPYGKQNGFPYNLNGIVFSQDHKSLITVKTNDGGLYRIGLKSGKVTELKTSEPLTKGDGLAWGANGLLYVIRNFENKISTVDFASPVKGVLTVRDLSPSKVNIPTGGVVIQEGDSELVVANSQFGVATPVLPFQLTRIGLEK